MFNKIKFLNKTFILIFSLLLLANMRTAFATDTSRSNDHDDLQMLQNYSLNYTKEFDGLAYFKAFRSNESVWENAPGGSSEYEIILTAVKNGIQSRLYIDSEANSPSQTMSIKIRRIAKLDNNNFWVEFESQTSSYRELYDDSNFIAEYYDVDTTWFASILTFDNLGVDGVKSNGKRGRGIRSRHIGRRRRQVAR